MQAIPIANRLKSQGKTDIEILVIDTEKLSPDTAIACNDLRQNLHIPHNNIHATEALVWQLIPLCAIASRWRCSGAEYRKLMEKFPGAEFQARVKGVRIAGVNSTITPSQMVEIVVQGLAMNPSDPVTKMVVLHLIAWSCNFAEVARLEVFENQHSGLVGQMKECLHLQYSQRGDLDLEDWKAVYEMYDETTSVRWKDYSRKPTTVRF